MRRPEKRVDMKMVQEVGGEALARGNPRVSTTTLTAGTKGPLTPGAKE